MDETRSTYGRRFLTSEVAGTNLSPIFTTDQIIVNAIVARLVFVMPFWRRRTFSLLFWRSIVEVSSPQEDYSGQTKKPERTSRRAPDSISWREQSGDVW